jgi:hypothetical protein
MRLIFKNITTRFDILRIVRYAVKFSANNFKFKLLETHPF